MSKSTICILTAGMGTRMGALTSSINKALAPINKKAVISLIIERFPDDSEFVIAVGYRAQEVREYISIAHPNLNVKFITVDNFDGPGSGPGHSLLQCREALQKPFHFVSCDTLWKNTIPKNANYDWMGISDFPDDNTKRFCNLQIEDGRIVSLKDKVEVPKESFKPFVGLSFIFHFAEFWRGLEATTLISNEVQVSGGNQALIEQFDVKAIQIDWEDVGDLESYKKISSRYENYDFSKTGEFLYIYNDKVIKFFADKTANSNRALRGQMQPKVYPKIVDVKDNFYSYNFVPGETFYSSCSAEKFELLLNWLKKELWIDVQRSPDFEQRCESFYRVKTSERIASYLKKYDHIDRQTIVNGQAVPALSELINSVPWSELYQGIPVRFHGDLQFDNIVYCEESDKFTLLDWRQDFAGSTDAGDMYYDLAKLQGGIVLNYDLIKMNLMRYKEDSNKNRIEFDFAQRHSTNSLLSTLKKFIEENNWSTRKVSILQGLIYLNMAPLHHSPFDKLLFSLGKLQLHRTLNLAEK